MRLVALLLLLLLSPLLALLRLPRLLLRLFAPRADLPGGLLNRSNRRRPKGHNQECADDELPLHKREVAPRSLNRK